MKRALIVTSVGGFLPQFEMNDARLLQRYGMEVIYASNFEKPVYRLDLDDLRRQGIEPRPISIEKKPSKLLRNLRAFFEVKRLIDQEQIDLVHCHNPTGGVIARLAAAFSRKKPVVIYTAHGFHFFRGAPLINWLLFYPIERVLAHFADYIVTINREDERRAKAFGKKYRDRVFLIHGVGVDGSRYQPNPGQRDAIRDGLGIPRDAFHIVTTAELNKNKNQIAILRAIAEAPDLPVFYSICGKGPWRDRLQEEIDRLHLGDRVKLWGYRHDIPAFLQSADCFAFPSYREGLGIAAIEALATGLPVIASENRGTREYVQEGINGLFCRADDPATFAAAIRSLAEDRQLLARLQSRCRESVRLFSLENTEEIMSEVYRRAIHGSTSSRPEDHKAG